MSDTSIEILDEEAYAEGRSEELVPAADTEEQVGNEESYIAGTRSIAKDESKLALCKKRRDVRNRHVHDNFVWIFFCIAAGVIAAMTIEAVRRGRPEIYESGVDSWGNVCGSRNVQPIKGVPQSGLDRTNHHYRLMLKYSTGSLYSDRTGSSSAPQFCVEKCPTKPILCRDFLKQNGYVNISNDVIDRRVCGVVPLGLILPHSSLLNACLPDFLLTKPNESKEDKANTTSYAFAMLNGNLRDDPYDVQDWNFIFGNVFRSVKVVTTKLVFLWAVAYLLCLLACFVGFILTGPLVYLAFMLYVIAFLGLIALMGWRCYVLWLRVDDSRSINSIIRNDININKRESIQRQVDTYSGSSEVKVVSLDHQSVIENLTLETLRSKYVVLGLSITLVVVFFSLLWALRCARRSIRTTGKVMGCVKKVVLTHLSLLLQPVLTAALCTLVVIGSFIVVVYMLSVVRYKIDDDYLVEYESDPGYWLVIRLVIHLVFTCWVLLFFETCQTVLTADTVATWYYRDRTEKRKCCHFFFPTVGPTKRLFLYHMGSALVNSLLLSLLRFVELPLFFVARRVERARANGNCCARCCGFCCSVKLQTVIGLFGTKSHVSVGIWGGSFAASARRAYRLFTGSSSEANIPVLFLAGLAFLVIKYVLLAVSMFVAYHIFTQQIADPSLLLIHAKLFAFLPFAITAIHLVFDVYVTTMNTLFLCSCDDELSRNLKSRKRRQQQQLRPPRNVVISQIFRAAHTEKPESGKNSKRGKKVQPVNDGETNKSTKEKRKDKSKKDKSNNATKSKPAQQRSKKHSVNVI